MSEWLILIIGWDVILQQIPILILFLSLLAHVQLLFNLLLPEKLCRNSSNPTLTSSSFIVTVQRLNM